ncbi:MAG: hypothetical protein PHW45_04490, partial [Candidatus ainarchaeum sp.]|nr:hypothetical protein [Candidatus ainarchaeum sp.]
MNRAMRIPLVLFVLAVLTFNAVFSTGTSISKYVLTGGETVTVKSGSWNSSGLMIRDEYLWQDPSWQIDQILAGNPVIIVKTAGITLDTKDLVWQVKDSVEAFGDEKTGISTGMNYTPQQPQIGEFLRLVVLERDSAQTVLATSNILEIRGYNFDVLLTYTHDGESKLTAQAVGEPINGITPVFNISTIKWFRDGIEIGSANSNPYTIQAADAGTHISASITGQEAYSGTTSESVPFAVLAPSITGTPEVGSTLRAAVTAPAGAVYTLQWQHSTTEGGYADIDGATADTYIPTAEDKGKTIRLVATNDHYFVDFVSNPLGPVTAVRTPLESVTLAGDAMWGNTLTGTVKPENDATSYQWQKSDAWNGDYADITGAASSTYFLSADEIDSYFRLKVTGTGDYVGELTSAYKGPVREKKISAALPANIFPVTDASAVTSFETTEYTGTVDWYIGTLNADGTVTWSTGAGTLNANGTFKANSEYRATITLTPKAGYTFQGVPENYYTLDGAVSVKNDPSSGTAVVLFPNTARRPITAIAPITGTPKAGVTLTAGALTPDNATASWQWSISETQNGTYSIIQGATKSTYVPSLADVGKYLKVTATGTGAFSDTETSAPTEAVQPKTVNIAAIPGITIPATNRTDASAVSTTQYTGTISWTPLLPENKQFQSNTLYNAIIALSPATGYTFSGIPANFFTVAGAASVKNDASSGVVTAYFFSTTQTPLTSVDGIIGISQVGEILTAGAVHAGAATLSGPAIDTYSLQWQKSDFANGPYAPIDGAANSTYTLKAGDWDKYIRLAATGTGNYS